MFEILKTWFIKKKYFKKVKKLKKVRFVKIFYDFILHLIIHKLLKIKGGQQYITL